MFDRATRIVAARWLGILAWLAVAAISVHAICTQKSTWLPFWLVSWIYLPALIVNRSRQARAYFAAGIVLGILCCDFREYWIARQACGVIAAGYCLCLVHSARDIWSWQAFLITGFLVGEVGFLWMLCGPAYSSGMAPRQVRLSTFAFETCGGWIFCCGVIVCLIDLCWRVAAKIQAYLQSSSV